VLCSVLQCAAVCRILLQCASVFFSVLQCLVMCCSDQNDPNVQDYIHPSRQSTTHGAALSPIRCSAHCNILQHTAPHTATHAATRSHWSIAHGGCTLALPLLEHIVNTLQHALYHTLQHAAQSAALLAVWHLG